MCTHCLSRREELLCLLKLIMVTSALQLARFIGCVDYVWFSPGGSEAAPWHLLPLAVLPPPPLETLHCALPSPAWPSDHISLVCDFALLNNGVPAQQGANSQRTKAGAQAHL